MKVFLEKLTDRGSLVVLKKLSFQTAKMKFRTSRVINTVQRQKLSPATSLATRFQQNWMAQYPQDNHSASGVNLDDSLTSLGWLQNLKVSEITQPRHVVNPVDVNTDHKAFIKQEPPDSPPPLLTVQTKTEPFLADVAPSCGTSAEYVDYKTNPYVKPPYSYASLICMAMKATRKNKITLSSIYNWITDNFIYYRLTDPSWQNSIRHNLSLNKCFEKVARRKDEPGKGGFWRINPDYGDVTEGGVFKKRRNSPSPPSPPLKRIKTEDEDDDDDDYNLSNYPWLKSGSREDKLLSNSSFRQVSYEDDSDDDSNRFTGDFNWTSILNQDIEIGGRTVKTEDIIDDTEPSPFIANSPPSSETNSDDLGLDYFFSQTDYAMDLPVDYQSNDPLDLTIQGTTIRPPEWWSMDNNNNLLNEIVNTTHNTGSGLNTPVPPSPDSDLSQPMWGQGNHSHFDLENLFELDNIPSPKV